MEAGEVEDNSGLRVQAQLLVILHLGLGGVVADEIGLEAGQFLSSGLDEHVLHEVGLPSHFHDEADGHAGVVVGAAEDVHDIELLAGELLQSQLLAGVPGFLGSGLVVVLELVGSPPHGVLAGIIHDDELVLGRAAGVDAGHDVDGAQLTQLALLIAFERGVHLGLKQGLVRGIVDNLSYAGDAILFQAQSFHCDILLNSIAVIP